MFHFGTTLIEFKTTEKVWLKFDRRCFQNQKLVLLAHFEICPARGMNRSPLGGPPTSGPLIQRPFSVENADMFSNVHF